MEDVYSYRISCKEFISYLFRVVLYCICMLAIVKSYGYAGSCLLYFYIWQISRWKVTLLPLYRQTTVGVY